MNPQDNVSYDHDFTTDPAATNPAGKPAFPAAPPTPTGNGLTPAVSAHNSLASNPERLDRSEALTGDQDQDSPEQTAFHGDQIDRVTPNTPTGCPHAPTASGIRLRPAISLPPTLASAA